MLHLKTGDFFSMNGRGLYIVGSPKTASAVGQCDMYGNIIGIVECIL